VIVRNVNRKPIIDSFSPEKTYEMDENSSASFEVSASDPDNNPAQEGKNGPSTRQVQARVTMH
jgi:hypothetical protein